MPKHPKGVK
jgi:pescadillo